jgi:hypothetical protein
LWSLVLLQLALWKLASICSFVLSLHCMDLGYVNPGFRLSLL